MRYLTLGEVVTLHRAILAVSGGGDGIRDLGALESAQPRVTCGAEDLYPSVVEKASALAFGLAMNPPSSTATSESRTQRWRSSST